MIKYPSIEQFRNVIRTVKARHDFKCKTEDGEALYYHDSPYPTLKFQGTVKIHGTNAGIVKYKDPSGFTDIEFQSRERVLSLDSDNAGFALAMSGKNLDFLFEDIDFKEYIAVYGEWCGGNIQKGVAVCQLPKMFVIFGCMVDGVWKDKEHIRFDNEQAIYNIHQFPRYDVEIDFNNPEAIQNTLIELTLAVEEKCPVGAYFGVNGIGEGLVFTCITDPSLKFKSKGEKHSSSKVKVLNSVDTEELESINEFVEYSVTENRLKQGIENLKANGIEISSKTTGDFLRWIVNDIMKEERDTIIKNQINVKKANSVISKKARNWYFSQL